MATPAVTPNPVLNPYAAYGGTVAPPAAGQSSDPYAAYGGKVSAATPAPPKSDNLSDNPNGEGTYTMVSAPHGLSPVAVAVPYSKVEGARASGYGMADQERVRYEKDRGADPNAPKPQILDRISAALNELPTVGLTKGFEHGAMSTVAGVGELANKYGSLPLPHANGQYDPALHVGALKDATDWLRAHAEDNGIWEQLGDMGENVAELLVPVLGEEGAAAKGATRVAGQAATFGDKAAATAKLAKFLEQNPRLAQLAAVGARAVKAAATGAVKNPALAGGQTFVKTGGDTGAAGEAAAGGAVTGGVLEGVGAGVGAARAAATSTAAARDAAQAAYEASPQVLAERTAAMKAARQATAQQMVKDTAKGATRGVIDRMNEAMQPPLAITGEPLSEANFQPIDADAAAARTHSFGDAADEAAAAAKPVYDKLDAATGGEFTKLKNARSAAYRSGNAANYRQATNAIDDLLKKTPEGVTPAEFAGAKSAWKDERDLDRIHNAVEGAFNGITEEMAAQPGTSARELKGGQSTGALQSRIGTLLRGKNALGEERIRELLGPEGMAGLYRASHLTSTPELRKATQELADAVAKEFPKPEPAAKPGVRGLVGHMTGSGLAAGAISHAAGTPYYETLAGVEAARYVLHQVVTNPAIGRMFEYAVDYGASPQNAAKTIAAMIQQQETQQSLAARDSAKQSQEKH